MAEVKVLVEGLHQLVDSRIEISCTTTLIKGEENILVDPGALVNKENLLKALKEENLEPEDIKIIILTHLHLDHITNIYLFENAKVFLRFRGETFYPGQFQEIHKGYMERFNILSSVIDKDIKIIETPGHTSDSISIIVNSEIGKIVIAGDAIGGEAWIDLEKKGDPNIFYDVDKFDVSRKKILEIADWIIPGHGKMFKVKR
jgi:glyoxylase-like metal-dependent hydrolase (beta-lactamase superfamily II)